ncbi:MAG: HD domain-containing protein [Spirochaetota bacterium]|nr:MAG: HD domain-containing protein [Spirochaetota bacterium]
MKELYKLKQFCKLKEISRVTKVKNRSESPAEHTWSSIILATYFLKKLDIKLDESRVFKLLLYHDVVEIESGDTFELDTESADVEEKERKAFAEVLKRIPAELTQEYSEAFSEYLEYNTPESKFAHAIDRLEPMVHQLDYKSSWKYYGYTEKVLSEKKRKYMEPFPELLEFYDKFIKYLKDNNYI